MPEFFLDTGFAIALASRRDQHHQRALDLANQIKAGAAQLVTTQAIVLDIGNSLSKQSHRSAAVQLITSLRTDPAVEILTIDDELSTNRLHCLATAMTKNGVLLTVCHSS